MATFKKSFMLLILYPTFLFVVYCGALFLNEVTLNLQGAKEVAGGGSPENDDFIARAAAVTEKEITTKN